MNISKVTKVIANNSTDFVKKIFSLYENKSLFAIDRTGNYLDEYNFLHINNIITPAAGHGWVSAKYNIDYSDFPAQIVFTSGTEGKPKAIVLSHKNLANVVDRLNSIMDVDSSIREYIGIPVSYSFGLGRCRAVSAAGGKFFIPQYGFNPKEIRQMLDTNEINAISAVPSLWNIILDSPEIIGKSGEKVHWIEIGSQFMSSYEKQSLKNLFPNAKIIQHYGLTEASRTTFLDITSTSSEFLESVGNAQDDIAIKISEKGNISIKGDHVAIGELSKNGNVEPLTDNDGWLETKDLGVIRDNYLWYLGRSDDQINIGGIKLSPDNLEKNLSQQFNCSNQLSIVGIPDRLRGMIVLLAYCDEIKHNIHQIEIVLLRILKENGVQTGSIQLFCVDSLPKTETGKIQRKKIAENFIKSNSILEQPHQPQLSVNTDLTKDENKLAQIWREVLGNQILITSNDSFVDLGGDSLSTLQIIIKMEKKGYRDESVQSMLRGQPLSIVAASNSENFYTNKPEHSSLQLPKETIISWALNSLRGLMVMIVLLAHWGPGLWERLFGVNGKQIDSFLNPLYRMGTPGFAVTFGIGIGFYFFSTKSAGSKIFHFGDRIKSIFFLVFTGWLLLSGVRFFDNILQGNKISGFQIANSFYNVLCFYVLSIISIPLWNRILRIHKTNLVYSSIVWAIIFWAINILLMHIVTTSQIYNLFELPRLMLIANYAYFRVGLIVFLGISIGCFLRRQDSSDNNQSKLAFVGITFFCVGLLTTLDFMSKQYLSTIDCKLLSMVLLYFGLAILILSGFIFMIKNRDNLSKFFRFLLNTLIVIGVLALPIFVFHGLVIPIKNILLHCGIEKNLSYIIPLGTFIFSITFFAFKIYILYFSTKAKVSPIKSFLRKKDTFTSYK